MHNPEPERHLLDSMSQKLDAKSMLALADYASGDITKEELAEKTKLITLEHRALRAFAPMVEQAEKVWRARN